MVQRGIEYRGPAWLVPQRIPKDKERLAQFDQISILEIYSRHRGSIDEGLVLRVAIFKYPTAEHPCESGMGSREPAVLDAHVKAMHAMRAREAEPSHWPAADDDFIEGGERHANRRRGWVMTLQHEEEVRTAVPGRTLVAARGGERSAIGISRHA